MELTEQDKKAAEEWYNDQIIKANQEEHVFNVGYEEFWLPLSATPESAFLAGIEHERKRVGGRTAEGQMPPQGSYIVDATTGVWRVDNPPAEGCQKEDGHE
jgi:hypothetical protein